MVVVEMRHHRQDQGGRERDQQGRAGLGGRAVPRDTGTGDLGWTRALWGRLVALALALWAVGTGTEVCRWHCHCGAGSTGTGTGTGVGRWHWLCLCPCH